MNFNWEITGITGDRQQQEQLIFCLENVYVYLNHARTINLSWTWKTVLQTYGLHAWNRWKQSNKPTATLFNIHPASPSSKNCTRCEEKTHTKKKTPKRKSWGITAYIIIRGSYESRFAAMRVHKQTAKTTPAARSQHFFTLWKMKTGWKTWKKPMASRAQLANQLKATSERIGNLRHKKNK